MFKNYLKTLYRNFLKNKTYSFINIGGLAVGIAAAVLILLFVRSELSYDLFNEKADNIFIVSFRGNFGGSPIDASFTSAPMAATLIQEYPEVLNGTRFYSDINSGSKLIEYQDNKFYESGWMWADSTVLDIFTYPLVKGNPKTALANPNSVLISEEMAQKYFGNSDPVGKILKYNKETDYLITGILKNIPYNTHLHFDFLASFSTLPKSRSTLWLGAETYSYILLKEGTDPVQFEKKLRGITEKYVAPQIQQALGQTLATLEANGVRIEYYIQPLKNLYLKRTGVHEIATASGNIQYIYIFSALALAIILIASINYMNLSTARASNRAREVGMRKVLGSNRNQLIKQFLSESIIISMFSAFIALFLIELFLPVFNGLTNKKLSLLGDLVNNFDVLFGIIIIAILVGLVAGLYPAFIISSFKPVEVLKGSVSQGVKHGWLRNGLVITQFAISITLIVATGIVFKQLNYMKNIDLGFSKDQVISVQLESSSAISRFDSFRSELLSNPNVINAGIGDAIPGRYFLIAGFQPEGAETNRPFSFEYQKVSFDYLSTLGVKFVAGRNFSKEFPSDSTQAWIINEKAVKTLGWNIESAIGKKIAVLSRGQNVTKTVIGVVKDFHFESLHNEIRPIAFTFGDKNNRYALVKVKASEIKSTMTFLEQKWSTFEPGFPFHYNFLNEDFGRLFEQEEKLGEFFTYFTVLAIFIACLGLFSLASFVTEQRTKEIGVRKVLGASVVSITIMFIKQFIKLVTISIIISFPLAFIVMNNWLKDFAYRTNIDTTEFIISGILALVISLLTVGYQSLKAAIANPIKSLKYE